MVKLILFHYKCLFGVATYTRVPGRFFLTRRVSLSIVPPHDAVLHRSQYYVNDHEDIRSASR